MSSSSKEKPKRIPDVVISCDLGGSLTKIAAVSKTGEYCLLALSSEVAEIPAEILKDVQKNHWGQASVESCIWVATKEGNGYALGSYAREQFMAYSNLRLSKLETAVPKILGALWVLQQKLNLPKRFTATLGVLLPDGECSESEKEELVELLMPEIKSFISPTGKMGVKLTNGIRYVKSPVIKPEGAGILSAYQSSCPEAEYSRTNVGYLGIGFRNSNLLVSRNGGVSLKDRHTSQLGFHAIVESVKEQIGSTVNEVKLASVIGQARSDINVMYLERFLKDIRKEKRLNNVIEAIKRAQKMYLCQLDAWLLRCQARELDRIVLYGGTVEYFRKDLTERFAKLDEIIWHSDFKIPKQLLDAVVVEREQSALHLRFIDSWCFLHYLCEKQEAYKQYKLSNDSQTKQLVTVGG